MDGSIPASAPPEAVTIVRKCGALPLALAMIGGMVRNGLAKGRSDAWATAVRRLQEARLDVIRQPLENYRYDALERAIESVDDLDDTIRRRYFTMGIFREDTAVPERVLAILWRCDEDDAQRTVDRWLDTSLATRDANGRITLHDLQLDYARRRVPSLPALHEQLIDRYREHYATEWPAIVGDPYFSNTSPLTWLGRNAGAIWPSWCSIRVTSAPSSMCCHTRNWFTISNGVLSV